MIRKYLCSKRTILLAAILLGGIVLAYTILSGSGLFGGANFDAKVIYSLDARNNDREIISIIDDARKYVYFAVYYFTQNDIADALIRAKRRGVEVEGITDREGALNPPNAKILKLLLSAGIPVFTQKHEDGIMHIKAVVSEGAYASGSYNWTQAATDANDEILEIGQNENVRRQYLGIVKKVIDKNRDADKIAQVKEIKFSDAPAHIGEYADVRGEILRVYTSPSGTTFLDFCKSSKNCPFSAVIFRDDRSKFGDVQKLTGKVKLSGIIRYYKGKAEITLDSPDQIIKPGN